jgi:4'-phosphopantetheinyl transferase
MIWLTTLDATAPSLPAAWLIRTGERPANLTQRSALRQATAQRVLAKQLGLPADAIGVDHDPGGRPLLHGPVGRGLHISLATRAGLVVVGLAEQPIGVDVERVEPDGQQPLAVLHPSERAILLALPPAARPSTFARLWSAKEAYVKALGTGFLQPPESFAVRLVSEERFTIATSAGLPAATGESLAIKQNGGQESLAAAIVVLA